LMGAWAAITALDATVRANAAPRSIAISSSSPRGALPLMSVGDSRTLPR
jgi:hypothetical protein